MQVYSKMTGAGSFAETKKYDSYQTRVEPLHGARTSTQWSILDLYIASIQQYDYEYR